MVNRESVESNHINFTERKIESLKCPQDCDRMNYHDTKIEGLGIRVRASGKKTYFWFRKVRGRPKWKRIGDAADLTVEDARAKGGEFNTALAKWKLNEYAGPQQLFDSKRGIPTLGEVVDAYCERWLRTQSKRPDKAIAHVRWQLNKYLSELKDTKLSHIHHDDIEALHQKLGSRKVKSGPGRGTGKFSANRAVTLVRAVFNWATEKKLWRGENPAVGIDLYPEKPYERKRFLQPEEMKAFFEALEKEPNRDLRDFITLTLFAGGARRGNVLAMRWSEILRTADDQYLWTVPDPKNSEPYSVPLLPEALAVLKERKLLATSEFVFPSSSKEGHVMDVKKAWKRFLQRAHLKDLRVHDLRRTVGSWMAGSGVSLPIIGKTLGHTSTDATRIYARLNVDPVREALTTATRAMVAASRKRPKLLEARND